MNRAGGSRARWTGKPSRVGLSEDTPINYRDALAWLYSLQRFGIKLGLENIQRLLAEVAPASCRWDTGWKPVPRVIHVAGTNGKGSVCAMIDSILRADNFHTGLFTSPHLVTFRERIRTNGEMISEKAVARGLMMMRDLVSNWQPHPTFFEITTALALKEFADSKSDIVVLETGLGGRLDATNAVASNVSVITPVALDHQGWLGHTLSEIAREKAGIIKPEIPVVCAQQQAEAEKVIRARAAECKAPLQFINEPYEQSPIGLRGAYQKNNAALAVAALRAARIDIGESAIERGLMAIKWPARFQLWDERTVIDGAHNPAAARVLVDTWQEIFPGQRATLILAVLGDKDLSGICEALIPISESILLPKIRSERAANPRELVKVLSSIAPSLPHSIAPTIADAIDSARARSSGILLTGSLHFAGEALAFLEGKPAAFEECAQ